MNYLREVFQFPPGLPSLGIYHFTSIFLHLHVDVKCKMWMENGKYRDHIDENWYVCKFFWMKSTSQWDEIMSMKLTQHLISHAKERTNFNYTIE